MRTSIVVAALLHHALSFMAPPLRVAPSLRVKLATRAATDDDATATAAEDAVAAVEDDATPKRRPLRGLWRRLRRRKAEEVAEPEPEQPPLKVGESVVVEATGRSGKVSLVAANGWCQVLCEITGSAPARHRADAVTKTSRSCRGGRRG